MTILLAFVLFLAAGAQAQHDNDLPPGLITAAPVIHDGSRHILSSGDTHVVLDGNRGMSITAIGHGAIDANDFRTSSTAVSGGALKVTLAGGGGVVEAEQKHDTSARLLVIDQGPARTAARALFTLRSADGEPYGTGTLDVIVCEGRVFLQPSLYIDDRPDVDRITSAGFDFDLPGRNIELIYGGSSLIATEKGRVIPFGGDDAGFSVTVENPGRPSMRIGWLRNRYPSWSYLRMIGENPETDELYERWPLWIVQRGSPLAWNVAPSSGLAARYEDRGLRSLSVQWANEDSLAVPEGGYRALNGVMGIFLAQDSASAGSDWSSHDNPLKPVMKSGAFKYYNEFEGLYEFDSEGGDVDFTIDNIKGAKPRYTAVRIWNLEGSGAWEATADNKPATVGLYNDGDYIDDPMVPIYKTATGPARTAIFAFSAPAGVRCRVTFRRARGIQFTYQMYSELETMEAWSDDSVGRPLFSFYITRGEISKATLPGAEEYAFFKLPVCWLKNGINQSTFMNRTRDFRVVRNGPDALRFTYTGVDLMTSGRSTFDVTIPYERSVLSFSVKANFESLGDTTRWTSLEYCDLYPFEHVYRRDFHYRDVTFLRADGVFDRVGTGAWSGGFSTVEFPDGMGYHAKSEKREGPGTRTPSSDDGSVWILGDNDGRGNIIYRRGEWLPTPGSRSVFSLCNAWVDIHNTIAGRDPSMPRESIAYTIEVFRGPAPPLDSLNAMYRKAAGADGVKRIVKVAWSIDGEMEGFETAK